MNEIENRLERIEFPLDNGEYDLIKTKEVVEMFKENIGILSEGKNVPITLDEKQKIFARGTLAIILASFFLAIWFTVQQNLTLIITMWGTFFFAIFLLSRFLTREVKQELKEEKEVNTVQEEKIKTFYEDYDWYASAIKHLYLLGYTNHLVRDRLKTKKYPMVDMMSAFLEVVDYLDLDLEKSYWLIPYKRRWSIVVIFTKLRDVFLRTDRMVELLFVDEMPDVLEENTDLTGVVMQVSRETFGIRKNAGYVSYIITTKNIDFYV